MKIEIKECKLTAGNRSLYLEYYETGFRKTENLHLYIVPEDSPKAKKLNREAYDKARGNGKGDIQQGSKGRTYCVQSCTQSYKS